VTYLPNSPNRFFGAMPRLAARTAATQVRACPMDSLTSGSSIGPRRRITSERTSSSSRMARMASIAPGSLLSRYRSTAPWTINAALGAGISDITLTVGLRTSQSPQFHAKLGRSTNIQREQGVHHFWTRPTLQPKVDHNPFRHKGSGSLQTPQFSKSRRPSAPRRVARRSQPRTRGGPDAAHQLRPLYATAYVPTRCPPQTRASFKILSGLHRRPKHSQSRYLLSDRSLRSAAAHVASARRGKT
jgi:hypothetical protein